MTQQSTTLLGQLPNTREMLPLGQRMHSFLDGYCDHYNRALPTWQVPRPRLSVSHDMAGSLLGRCRAAMQLACRRAPTQPALMPAQPAWVVQGVAGSSSAPRAPHAPPPHHTLTQYNGGKPSANISFISTAPACRPAIGSWSPPGRLAGARAGSGAGGGWGMGWGMGRQRMRHLKAICRHRASQVACTSSLRQEQEQRRRPRINM